MAKSVPKPASSPAVVASGEGPALDLKDRYVAAGLTWLIPGLGHFYQGRRAKAAIFLVCILGTFLYGLFMGEGRVVYAQWQPREARRLQFLCQIGVGLPSLPALVAANLPDHASLPFTGGRRWYMQPTPHELNELNLVLNRRFELGTVYTMIAGLLNLLAIYDACCGPAYGLESRSKSEGEDDEPSGDGEGKSGDAKTPPPRS